MKNYTVTDHHGNEIKNPESRRNWLWGEILRILNTYADLLKKPRIDQVDFIKTPKTIFVEYHTKWINRFTVRVPLEVNEFLQSELTRCISSMGDLYNSDEKLSALYTMSYYTSNIKEKALEIKKNLKKG